MKRLSALVIVALSLACGYGESDPRPTPGSWQAAPLQPSDAGPEAGLTDWRDVPAGQQFTGLQSYHACQDSCPGAAGLEFYAASDYCVCTCADGSWVESHPYDRTLADALASTWKAVCPR